MSETQAVSPPNSEAARPGAPEPNPPINHQRATDRSNRRLIFGIWFSLLLALLAALYLLRSYMLSTWGADAFESACNLGKGFNCDQINTSDWGKLAGLPLTLYALPTYVAMAGLAWLGTGHDGKSRAALRLLQLSSAASLIFGLFLVFVMITIEHTLCLFCLGMDVATLAVFALSTLALARLGPAREPNRWGSPLRMALFIGGTLFACAWLWFDDTKAELVAAEIARAEATQIATNSAIADLQSDKKRRAESTPSNIPLDQKDPSALRGIASADTTAKASGRGTYAGLARHIAGNKYIVPVHSEDPTFGPDNAKVTVVEYTDFECPYCKKLFYVMELLKERFAGHSVRFVFKHFPMNTLCNKHVKNNRHPYACNASLAAECARRQRHFWDLYRIMFKNQHRLSTRDLRHYVQEVGMNLSDYLGCMRQAEPRRILSRDMDEAALGLGIKATPRTFIDGTLYPGAVSFELLSHAIEEALKSAGDLQSPDDKLPKIVPPPSPTPLSAGGGQVRLHKRSGLFWIDAYEASIDAQGRALSLPNVQPANANWDEARAACKKAGKRLCTSEEWVTACQGKPAIDDDKDGDFANDYIEGNQFPYADYYEEDWCRVNEDRVKGRPGKTGTMARCHTPTGIFDLAGNVEEWIGLQQSEARLAGGDFRVQEKGSCYRAHSSFGPGQRNHSTGFRCCSSKPVANKTTKAIAHAVPETLVGQEVPAFNAKAADGRKIGPTFFKGKVTLISFFASWCTPCRRELPALKELLAKFKGQPFQILAIGVDTEEKDARAFVSAMQLPFAVLFDPKARILGLFDVQNMPSGYVVDKDGKIVQKLVGFGDKTMGEIEFLVSAHVVRGQGGHPPAPAASSSSR